MPPMNPGPLRIRRATVEDLPALQALWHAARLPAAELEGRLTEFQVVEAGGQLAGALGMEIVPAHIRLHSEDYADFSIADAARELFWERIQKLAAHHGAFRVWTQETSPFWTHWGFQPPTAETLERLPEAWKNLAGRWLTLELKDAAAIESALQHQTAAVVAGKNHAARIADRARKIRNFSTALFFLVGGIGLAIAVYLLIRHPLPAH